MAEPLQRARIFDITDLTPHVRELRLAPEAPVPFQAGQWISLKLPIGQHPPLVRAYSMTEPTSSSTGLVLVVDQVPHGLGSGYLFTLRRGDEVLFTGPHGKFLLPDPLVKDLLFMARYSGIAPIRCMLKQLFDTGCTRGITLIHTAPCESERLYHDEFTELASRHFHFQYVPLTSALRTDQPVQDWPEAAALQVHLAAQQPCLPYICGVKGFVRPLRSYLMERGFERRDIRTETYD